MGVPGDDSLGLNTGSVRVYRNNGSVWTSSKTLDALPYDGFGFDVSLSGSRAAIGSQFGAGSYLFRQTDSIWGDDSTRYSADWGWQLSSNPEFGTRICISDSFVVTGAPGLAYIQVDSDKEQD